jgi:DNA-binding NtrC family response regulator
MQGGAALLHDMHPAASHPTHDDLGSMSLPASMGARLRPNPLSPPTRAIPNGPIHQAAPAYAPHPTLSSTIDNGGTATSALTATNRLLASSLEARVDVIEHRIIEDCMKRNNFRRKETAAELGISRVTLYNKMKKFGLL